MAIREKVFIAPCLKRMVCPSWVPVRALSEFEKGKDILLGPTGMVHRPNFQPKEPNGLSCVPRISDLPRFALPVEWGGKSKQLVVWMIEAADLGLELVVQEDTEPGAAKRHLSIGPSGTMSCDDYERALAATRAKWMKVTKP
jgi:hypothetical protein